MGTFLQIDEESLVREKIAEIALPKGVRFKRIEQGAEWTGEPALRIYFSVSKKIPLTKRRLTELGRMKDDLQDRIFSLRLDKWPFIHFLDAR